MSLIREIKQGLINDVFRPYGVRSMSAAERSLSDEEVYNLTGEAEDFIVTAVTSAPWPDLFDTIAYAEHVFEGTMSTGLDHLRSSPYVRVVDFLDVVRAAVIDTLVNEILD